MKHKHNQERAVKPGVAVIHDRRAAASLNASRLPLRARAVRSVAFPVVLFFAACHGSDKAAAPSPGSAAPAPGPVATAFATSAPAVARVREGSALARSADGTALYVADEDHAVVRRVPLPLDVHAPPLDVKMPGPPAQLLVLGASGRLFVGRQALGATGKRAWNGQATVDVLLTADETELATGVGKQSIMLSEDFQHTISLPERVPDFTVTGPGPTTKLPPFVAPRAAIYRKATKTLLVASEGTDELVELDALSLDPSAKPLRRYDLATRPELEWPVDTWIRPASAAQDAWVKAPPGATQCGAPTGVALSVDEKTAWVFCRSTDSIAIVTLDAFDGAFQTSPIPTVSIGADPLPEQAALGRRLFYDATDLVISQGYACNGCHPEGRDDGHVWHELEDQLITDKGVDTEKFEETGLAAYEMTVPDVAAVFARRKGGQTVYGAPRQTPMLAGRLAAAGPFGWKGLSPNLRHRVVTGFKLHRWDGYEAFGAAAITRADAIAAFVRTGLVVPPRDERALTPEEERGRAVFNNPECDCASCHVPNGGEYTNRSVNGFGPWRFDKLQFEEEKRGVKFKTPSLRFVGSTPPYYHDGSAATLEDLVEHNGSRMGHTEKLSTEDRAALVAFLKTL